MLQLQDTDLPEAWRSYKARPTPEVRNLLMEQYLHLVRFHAERIHRLLPKEVELDDLMSAGLFGLMDAIASFDLDHGVKFETYANPRIRGAILDELRSMDWAPRLVRERGHKLAAATAQLQAELGRPPTQAELAVRLKVSLPEMKRIARDGAAVDVTSLSRKRYETDGGHEVVEAELIAHQRAVDPARAIQRHELQQAIARGLSPAERLLLILYYFEELTMREIGMTLGLSESRVSQMHGSILARLKARLRPGDLVH